MEIAILIFTISANIILLMILINSKKNKDDSKQLEELKKEISRMNSESSASTLSSVQNSIKILGDMLSQNQKSAADNLSHILGDIDAKTVSKQQAMNEAMLTQLNQLEQRLKTLESNNEQKLDAMRETISKRLSYIQEDNNKKLGEIQNTVNEKLQKTLEEKMNQSFSLVSTRLEEVYKGLGEMQTLAQGVGDLKKVLSNVKTRGILGEVQLGAILRDILAPEQYEENVATVPQSANRVEFAVKLPGDGNTCYLPIDSKFPGDTYAALQDAYDSGSPEAVNAAVNALCARIKSEAKDISTKYIQPPYTTSFAIMFLPFEGLYAEVVNRGMVEILQRDYNVNVAGPSTMAALLNSLQMGFKTLAIQKRSGEVWQILSAVKSEFEKFEAVLESTQKHLRQVDGDLDKLIGVRSRAISRKLRSVETLEDTAASELLEI